VEVGYLAAVNAGDYERYVSSGKRLKVAPDPLQRAVVGDRDYASVKGNVEDGLGVGIAQIRSLLHLLDVALEFLEVRVRHPGRASRAPRDSSSARIS